MSSRDGLRLRVHQRTRSLTLTDPCSGTRFDATLPAGARATLAPRPPSLERAAPSPRACATIDGRVLEITLGKRGSIEGTLTLGRRARPGRITAPEASRVVQTGIGCPDTGLNDTVYDPDTDLAVRFDASEVSIATQGQGVFAVRLRDARRVRVEVRRHHLRSICPYLPKGPVRIKPPAPTGWLSYYCHFEWPTEAAILEDLDVAGAFVDYGFSFFLVEMWQRNAKRLPVYQFHHEAAWDEEKFPHGMKWLAGRIRAKGLRPGIWAVPLGTGNPALFEAHPDWFIRDASGQNIRDWSGLFMFDPTHPEARKHIAEQLRVMAEEWGYEFFKLDGLSGRSDHYSEWFYSVPSVRATFSRKCAEPYRDMVKLIRRTLGTQRYLLQCAGDFRGAGVGLSEGARTGGDVFFSGEAGSWGSIQAAASVILEALFTNRYVWHTDPDILSVRPPLTVDQARAWATLFGVTGVFMASSDRLAKLPSKRLDILKRVLPAADVLPMDLAPRLDRAAIWNLAIDKPFDKWNVAAVFNWEGERRVKERIRFAELGLKPRATYLIFDFWNQTFLGEHRGSLSLDVDPQACRVLAIHERRNDPQVVSTNRHITQGAVSIWELAWDGAEKTLSGGSDLVAGDPYDLFIHVPKGLQATHAESDARAVSLTQRDGPIAKLRLKNDDTAPCRWVVRFERV